MSWESSEILRAVFAIDDGTIRGDLQTALVRHREISAELDRLAAIPCSASTSEDEARAAHLNLLLASVICAIDSISLEERCFIASSAVASVACHAEAVGASSAKAADLLRRLDEIKVRELGQGAEESDFKGAAPADFHQLDNEFGDLVESGRNVVFSFLLERYDMPEQLKLFEDDNATFEILVEIGQRVLRPREPDQYGSQRFIDAYLERTHGAATLQWIRTRSRELRRAREK